ncbi:MAG: HAMP domain-containing histidine kinase [Chitinophagaceae bacterium]|nr:MAG: HAMP domain-containing histidine kinase [Chitinophagaceae bacterium]
MIKIREEEKAKKPNIWFYIFTVVGFLFAATIAGFLLLQRRVLRPLETITNKIGKTAPAHPKGIRNELEILEHTIGEYLKQVERRQGELVRQAEVEALAQVSNQVAHDIRSPLAALEMVLKDLSNLPEAQRLIVRSSTGRIRDISNDLLHRNDLKSLPGGLAEVKPELVSALIEAISSAMQHSYAGMKENARTFALEYLTMHSVIDRFLGDIMPERAQAKVPLATITTNTQVKEEPAESSDMMSYTTGQ